MSSALPKFRAWIFLGLFFISGLMLVHAEESKADSKFPQTLAELNRWYAEPATNGARYFLKAYQIITNNVPLRHYTNESGRIGGYIDWPETLTNRPLPRAVKSSLTPFIRAIDMAWPSLEQGAKCGPCKYSVDLSQGWNVWMFHLTTLSGDSLGCWLRAISEADARHPDAALDSVLMGLAIAQSLKLEPLEISQEVRGNMQTRAVAALEEVINRVSLPTNRLDRLQEVFDQLEMEETKGDDFERGLAGTKLIFISYFDSSSNQLCELATNLIGGRWFTNYTLQQIPQLIAKGWKTRDTDRKLIGETFDKMLSIWKEGYPKRFDIDEVFQTRIVDLAQRQFGFVQLPDPQGRTLMAANAGKVIVRLRLAETAVALERYRAGHQNRYPDSLNSLVPDFLPAVPEDIFNGSPLQYHRRADGYLLYSVGSNRKDDDGDRYNDLIFQILHPPGRAVIE